MYIYFYHKKYYDTVVQKLCDLQENIPYLIAQME